MNTGEPTLTFHLTTVSRPALAPALRALRAANLHPGDEVLLVGDGPQPAAEAFFRQLSLPGRYHEFPGGPHGWWGHDARNGTMHLARAEYLAPCDDDDEYAPGAIDVIRRALKENPGRPHLFRMSGVPGIGTVWKDREIRPGNVGTPMLILPTAGQRWAKYTHSRIGDHDFIRDTLALWPPDALVWREEIIYTVRPWQAR